MNIDELKEILSEHEKWLEGFGGKQANLAEADLRGFESVLRHAALREVNFNRANLSGIGLNGKNLTGATFVDADLRDAELWNANLTKTIMRRANLDGACLWNTIGNRKEIKSIMVSSLYHINYTKDRLQIGCENHATEDWWEFTDRDILEMDGAKALRFWREWKNTIRMIIEKSPAL